MAKLTRGSVEMRLREGMLVRRKNKSNDVSSEKCWVVLRVRSRHIRRRDLRALNTDRVGLHGFSGLWYGRKLPLKIRSYGKITQFDLDDEFDVIHENVEALSQEELTALVN